MIVPVQEMSSVTDFTGQTCCRKTFLPGRYPAHGIDVLLFDYGALGRSTTSNVLPLGEENAILSPSKLRPSRRNLRARIRSRGRFGKSSPCSGQAVAISGTVFRSSPSYCPPTQTFPLCSIRDFCGTIDFRRIPLATTSSQYKYYPDQDSFIVNSLLAARVDKKGKSSSISSSVNQTRCLISVNIVVLPIVMLLVPKS